MARSIEVTRNVSESDTVIPAVRGEFYLYQAQFSPEHSLYALMKCKANKARPLGELRELGREANLAFIFGDSGDVQASTVRAAQAFGLLGDGVNAESFDEAWIAPAGLTVEEFRGICAMKNVATLVKATRKACSAEETTLALKTGMVVALVTAAGKYGLFLVKELAPDMLKIEACHILL